MTKYTKFPTIGSLNKPPSQAEQRGRILPREINTGVLRGTQGVGGTGLIIDNENRQIGLSDGTTSMNMGEQSDDTIQLVYNDGATDVVQMGDLGSDYLGLAFNDLTDSRIFIGQDAAGDYVAKLSQEGYDAKTAGDENLVWSSDFNLPKIVASGEVEFEPTNTGGSMSQGTYTKTVAHNLGFIPSFLSFVSFPGSFAQIPAGNNQMPITVVNTSSPPDIGLTLVRIWAYIDDTNIYFRVLIVPSSYSYGFDPVHTFKYYLFRETLPS